MGKTNNLVEVVFKGERRAVYRNRHELDIKEGDLVVVEADRGEDLGKVSFVGELVRLKRGKGETKSVIRLVEEKDAEALKKNQEKEKEAFKLCKDKVTRFNLDMKLVDVEVQFDGSKITFYFTAAQRVDFRELVKDLASVYRTRIELRQIGVRDEAKRFSGIGVCGRKQCCSSFLNDFEQITTQLAKDQQLSLNPTKISGNCGRLFCCLQYEEHSYLECLKQFPPPTTEVTIDGKKGVVCFVNVFDNKAQVRFEDGVFTWFTPEELTKGQEKKDEQ